MWLLALYSRYKSASVAQLEARLTGNRRLQVPPPPSLQHAFVEIDYEIFSTVILSLPLIQEGQLSVSGERMCTILVNSLEDYACQVKVLLGKLTTLCRDPIGLTGP